MKRAAILTRTDSINFGTILQNYALQKAVKDFGYEVKTIDDRQPRRLYSGKTEQKPAQDSLKDRIYRWYDQKKNNVPIKGIWLFTKSARALKSVISNMI